MSMPLHLQLKRTSEMTEDELRTCHEIYILNKTVNGIYCPTPEYGLSEEEDILDDETTRSKNERG